MENFYSEAMYEDVCLIVYEKLSNPCSERTGLIRWFKEHNIELIEWIKPSKVIWTI